jgi:hypothetical protein
MRVSDSQRVLFVHVPKTGGSSVDHLFDTEVPDARKIEGRQRHAPYGRLLSAEPELADYWSFGFVRNPWARLVSWWSMLGKVFARAEAGHPAALEKLRRHPEVWYAEGEYRDDFARFVLEGTHTLKKVGRPQVVTLSAGDRQVDFVGRLETFDRDVAVVRERLGLAPAEAVPHVNRTKHGDYRTFYTNETRDHVAEVFAADIEAFGYTF